MNDRRDLKSIADIISKEIIPLNPVQKPPQQPLDLDRAGKLSSQVFNDMTGKILAEMIETVESQINDAANRRAHAKASMEQLNDELDKVWSSFEADIKKHQERLTAVSEAIKRKVDEDTKEMVALSERLKTFSNAMDKAHEMFFSEIENKESGVN
jgi:F0F1-type ATP synthase membrane subunit b/b'